MLCWGSRTNLANSKKNIGKAPHEMDHHQTGFVSHWAHPTPGAGFTNGSGVTSSSSTVGITRNGKFRTISHAETSFPDTHFRLSGRSGIFSDGGGLFTNGNDNGMMNEFINIKPVADDTRDRVGSNGSSGYSTSSWTPSSPQFAPSSSQFDPARWVSSPEPVLPSGPPPATIPLKGRQSRKLKEQYVDGDQEFAKLTDQSVRTGVLHRDMVFPAEPQSLYFSMPPNLQGSVEWKRPFEICKDPKFIADERDRFDLVQGQLGDCWLVAAMAGLTLNMTQLNRVCPPEQSFNEKYGGAFRFRFWRFGQWKEVIVDDRLPTVHGQLVYVHSAKPNEFWSALMEKAYAKMMGSYEALVAGCSSEGFTDFTGGLVELVSIRQTKNLRSIMLKSFQRKSFMSCGIDGVPGVIEQELSNGLVCGHAYSITSIKEVPGHRTPICLIRMRNPWGSEHEWKGPWSDRSAEWQKIASSTRADLGLTASADGEFWMSLEDFSANFHTVEICHLPPDTGENSQKWAVMQKEGAWVSGISAGGCSNYQDTFHTNPQYRVTLSEPDDGQQDGLCTLIVSITQKDRRKRTSEGAKNLTIGYSILQIPGGTTGSLDKNTLTRCQTIASIPQFINSRDVSQRHELPPGDYVIIPSTFKPDEKGEFLLRLFTEKATTNQELDEETSLTEPDDNSINFRTVNQTKTCPQTPVEKKNEETMMNNFRLLAGEDEEIDAWELKKAVTHMFRKEFPGFDGFGIEACRSMIAMHDGDLSGKLGIEEYATLYRDLNKWKNVFKQYDVDGNGNFDIHELRNALGAIGFRLSNRLLMAISRRYCSKTGQVDVGDFILATCRLKTLIKTFEANKSGKSAVFPLEEFITSTIYM